MENALYYTLSTIAQTLAGALAILVAVALFRLSSLAQTIETGKSKLRIIPVDLAITWPILRDQGFEPLADRLEKDGYIIRLTLGLRPDLEAALAAYQGWGRINRRLYSALGFSVVDISLCFLALPFTRWIACSPWSSAAILFPAVGLGIISLCLYVWLITAMVKRPAE